jgi:hypothetical protein
LFIQWFAQKPKYEKKCCCLWEKWVGIKHMIVEKLDVVSLFSNKNRFEKSTCLVIAMIECKYLVKMFEIQYFMITINL